MDTQSDKVRFTISIHPFRATGALTRLSVAITMTGHVSPDDLITTAAILYPHVFRDMPVYKALTGQREDEDDEMRMGPIGPITKEVGDVVLIPNPDTGELMLGWEEYLFGLFTAKDDDAIVSAFLRSLSVESLEIQRISHEFTGDPITYPKISANHELCEDGFMSFDGPMSIPGTYKPGTLMCSNCDKPHADCPMKDKVKTYILGSDNDPGVQLAKYRAERSSRIKELEPLIERLVSSSKIEMAKVSAAKTMAEKIKAIMDNPADGKFDSAAVADVITTAKKEYDDAVQANKGSVESNMDKAVKMMSRIKAERGQKVSDTNKPIGLEDIGNIMGDLDAFFLAGNTEGES